MSGILSGISSDILFCHSIWHSILAFYLAFYPGIQSGILSWHYIWHSIKFLWYGHFRTSTASARSQWAVPRLRSSSGHWDLAPSIEVQQCPLTCGAAAARGWGAGGRGEGGGRGGQDARLIKSRDPHLAGGEKSPRLRPSCANSKLCWIRRWALAGAEPKVVPISRASCDKRFFPSVNKEIHIIYSGNLTLSGLENHHVWGQFSIAMLNKHGINPWGF